MIHRSAIMIAAWTRYRVVAAQCGYAQFCRRLFARVLRFAWINARVEAARARRTAAIVLPAADGPTALDLALQGLVYLPAHMSYARAADAVRARFPLHA